MIEVYETMRCRLLSYRSGFEDGRQQLTQDHVIRNILKWKDFSGQRNDSPLPLRYQKPIFVEIVAIGVLLDDRVGGVMFLDDPPTVMEEG